MTSSVHPQPLLHPLGDQALVLEFGTGIDLEVNRRACHFAQALHEAAWPWVSDVVPSFTGVGVHYRVDALPAVPGLSPLAVAERELRALLARCGPGQAGTARQVRIPVCYGGEHGPDLAEVAQRAGLSEQALIERHTATTGHVFMVGFAPGHPYLGLWDEAFAIPRRSTPRTFVPAGTVAVANRQTDIYPFDLPGGWNLIGRTPLTMFDPARAQPGLVEPGDAVRFCAITLAEFDAIAAGTLAWDPYAIEPAVRRGKAAATTAKATQPPARKVAAKKARTATKATTAVKKAPARAHAASAPSSPSSPSSPSLPSSPTPSAERKTPRRTRA